MIVNIRPCFWLKKKKLQIVTRYGSQESQEGKGKGGLNLYTKCVKTVIQHFSMLQQPQLPRNLFPLLKSTTLIEFFQHAQDALKSLLWRRKTRYVTGYRVFNQEITCNTLQAQYTSNGKQLPELVIPCEPWLNRDIPNFYPIHCSTLAHQHHLFITFFIFCSKHSEFNSTLL